MSVLDRIQAVAQARQSWPLGAGTIMLGDATWGHAQDEYAPREYGDYITTSNAVYACATLRARLLSSLPLRAYRERPRLDTKEAVKTGPLADLLTGVNPYWTLKRLVQMTELSLCLWGHCPWFINRGTSGRLPPSEIFWGRPDGLRPVIDQSKYITGYLYYPQNATMPIAFDAGEVVWFRYPNPLDEFAGLSPLAAARLAADYASAAMKANKNLFEHGLHMGGMISLADNKREMTPAQAIELENLVDKRYRGTDNAHRWLVLRHPLNVQGLSITPKDADYLGGLKQSLEDVCRAYGIPLDLIGGQRTYENADSAMRAVWTQTIVPESELIAAELTEQLLPMFGGLAGANFVEFDTSDVEELKEEETEAWTREKEQLTAGVLTINQYLADKGKDPVPWGDVWWAPMGVKPVKDGEPPPAPEPFSLSAESLAELMPGEKAKEPEAAEAAAEPGAGTGGECVCPECGATLPHEAGVACASVECPKCGAGMAKKVEEAHGLAAPQRRGIAYGSAEHRTAWERFASRTDKQEATVGETVAGLFHRQEASILAKLRKRSQRDIDDLAENPFDKARWIRDFRVAIRPNLRNIVEDAGQGAIADLGMGLAFDVVNPAVARFIEQRAQRFARQVNDTTWDELRRLFATASKTGQGIDEVADEVNRLMESWWRTEEVETGKPVDRLTRAQIIARTEVVGANNGGTLEGWRQAQDLIGPLSKHWVAALDDRTRDSHIDAHNRYNGEDDGIPLEDDFIVGAGSGPAPGQIGLAEEDIQCRCTVVATRAPF